MALTKKQIIAQAKNISGIAGVNKLVAIVNSLDDKGRQLILQALSSELSEAKKVQILAALRQHVSVADAAAREWIVQGISKSYVEGANWTVRQLKDIGYKSAKNVPPLGQISVSILSSSPAMKTHLQAVNTLISDAYLDFGTSMTGYVKGAERILNDALKRQVRSNIAIGRLEGASVATIKKVVKETFQDKGFTVLLSRNGRQWTLGQYSEMVTRTHLTKANNEATINRAGDFGVDIVEVSAHGAEDDACADEEGEIYSISGKSENYPPLDGHEPPYHPNCTHNLLLRPDLS